MIRTRIRPFRLLIVGFVLVLTGFLIPFAVVLKMIENTFFLSFFAYGAQVSGLILGVIGAANYVTMGRGKDDETDW